MYHSRAWSPHLLTRLPSNYGRSVFGRNHIKIDERKISPDELSNFKGCFITGTAAEITPVGSIADNNFEVCDLIKDLSTSYEVLVGKNN